ncbi:MAG: hypothetical protein ACRDMH_16205 [Solirubrobacterales bacterium]
MPMSFSIALAWAARLLGSRNWLTRKASSSLRIGSAPPARAASSSSCLSQTRILSANAGPRGVVVGIP